MTRLHALHDAGVSIWLDTLSRELLDSGDFARLIADHAVTGATSNPTIFAKAIIGSDRYDEQLRAAVAAGMRDPQELFFELALDDVRRAADLLRPTYDESERRDGFVSFECTPDLADDSEATVEQALELWDRLARPNVMIKVPATEAGVPAIEELTARGVNVNVTLLFSVARYEQVIDAYMGGLERRLAAGQPIDAIASVASFFVSRIDSKVDALLPADSRLRGRVAIATRGWPTRVTSTASATTPAWRMSAGSGSGTPARGPSDHSGRAPAPRTPPTPTSSTSTSWSPRTPSTPCPRRPCGRSRTTATCDTRWASPEPPTRRCAEHATQASTSTPSRPSSSARA
jgi:transaldolase